MRRSLRATTSWRTSSASPGSAPRARWRPLGEQPGQLGLDVERRLAAGALPVGLRLQHLADLGLAGLAPSRLAGPSLTRWGRSLSNSTANWPLPICFRAFPAPSTKVTSAIGIVAKTTIRITSPVLRLSASGGTRLGYERRAVAQPAPPGPAGQARDSGILRLVQLVD